MDIKWLDFQVRGDDRGQLIAIETGRQVPFQFKRTYYLYGTLLNVRRGMHAHHRLRQAAICVSGSLTMTLDDGASKVDVVLDRRDRALLIEPMIWHEMTHFSPDCVLLVLADEFYDEADYIRSYPAFLAALKQPARRLPIIHPRADVQTSHVGDGTTIWQDTIVLKGARIGADCNLNAHCFVENDVVIGDRVTLKCGVYVWDAMRIADDVFVGPNVTFCNDRMPRSKKRPEKFVPVILEKGCSIGAGAIILPGVTVGENAMVGAGAVVTRDVKPFEIVVGNPAAPIGEMPGDQETVFGASPLAHRTINETDDRDSVS